MNRYRIEPGRSRFSVQAFAAGLLSAFAHSPTFGVRDYAGMILVGATAESLEVELTINPGSLDLQDPVKDSDRREIEDRMRGEVLESAAYREIAYHGRAAGAETIGQGRYRLAIAGDLTLHGVTRPQRLEADLTVYGDGLRLGGGGTLSMSAYGIRPVTALGGTIRLKDELSISFDLAALPEPS